MIMEYINSIMTIIGYFVVICTFFGIVFSMVLNKKSDKEREKREFYCEQCENNSDPADCTCNVHIVRSGRGSG